MCGKKVERNGYFFADFSPIAKPAKANANGLYKNLLKTFWFDSPFRNSEWAKTILDRRASTIHPMTATFSMLCPSVAVLLRHARSHRNDVMYIHTSQAQRKTICIHKERITLQSRLMKLAQKRLHVDGWMVVVAAMVLRLLPVVWLPISLVEIQLIIN